MADETIGPKPWALLAYTIADDESGGDPIDAPVKNELKAICDASDFGQISVAAQVDFKYKPGVFRASLTTMSRDFEDIPAESQPLFQEILSRLERSSDLKVQRERVDLNAASGNVLRDFLTFGVQECPAERYVVFMYGHSSGPMGLFYDRGSGQHVPNTLRLNDLADAMRAVNGRVAVVIFRDCFMNTLEAAYQLRGAADFVVASQSVVPIAGIWPWRHMMTTLKPGAVAGDVARALAMQIGTFLDDEANRGPFADAPLSLIDVSAAEAAAEHLKALADALDTARTDPARCRACMNALEGARVGYPDDPSTPGDPALLDVPTMCDNLQQLEPDPVAAPAKALGDIVRSRLVNYHHTQKERYKGTSIYYKPVKRSDLRRSHIQSDGEVGEQDAADYKRLALNMATGWDRIALNPLVAPLKRDG
jgi:hypothetical protein